MYNVVNFEVRSLDDPIDFEVGSVNNQVDFEVEDVFAVGDFDNLINKPLIEGVVLVGNRQIEEVGGVSKENIITNTDIFKIINGGNLYR